MNRLKSNKIIILHCGYPKAASATLINDMRKIAKNYNVIDTNENQASVFSWTEYLKDGADLYHLERDPISFMTTVIGVPTNVDYIVATAAFHSYANSYIISYSDFTI